MPIKSYTGLPGHGKTSLMVEELLREAKKAQRPLWAAGIDGLQPGIASILKDPRDWNAVKPGETCTCHVTEDSSACESHVIPNGSLIFVDEAWKWFGHLQNATRQSTPDHVLQLAEHRHRGIDFVWTYQQPCQIYPFARGLCAEHYHVVRRFGTQFIEVFKWQELNEEVKSQAKRESAQRVTRTLPEDSWKAFKSAEVHTIKRRIPFRVLALPALAVAAVVLGWFAYGMLKPSAMAASIVGSEAGTAPAGPARSTHANGSEKDKPPLTAAEYARRHLPRFPTMPHTAEIFDERGITADPQLFCMSSEAGEGADGYREASVICLTEQGTRYDLGEGEARRVARWGTPYNPYKQRERSESRNEAVPVASGSTAPSAIALDAPQISAYGDIGVGQ